MILLPKSTHHFRKFAEAHPRVLRGFTLIELLVVIVIISVLLALSVVVTSKVMANSRDASCLSNLRELGRATLSFANDFNGYLPDSQIQSDNPLYPNLDRWPQWLKAGRPYWYTALNRYLNDGQLYVYTGRKSIFQCPASTPEEQYVNESAGTSYVMNHSLGTTRIESTYTPQPKLVTILQPSKVGVYMDGYAAYMWASAYKANTPGNPKDTNRRLRLRHQQAKAINVVFLDGHVESIVPIQTIQGFNDQIWPAGAYR